MKLHDNFKKPLHSQGTPKQVRILYTYVLVEIHTN
jgi:hypothetical protein